jgi:type I restriction enzyme S subunit
MKTNSKWEMKKLGDVCDVIAGQSPDGKYYNNNGKGVPFYQGKKEFTDKYVGCPAVWTTEITKEAQKGDILMSVRAPVGPINFATEKICIGRGLAAIRSINEKEFSNDYLFLFLISIQDKIKGSAGAVFASINKKQIEDILVLVPPRDEQKRIVSKLDKLFENTKKLEDIARRNLQNAKDIFNNVLKETFRNKADTDRLDRKTLILKTRWEVRRFDDCIDKVTYSAKLKKKDFLSKGQFPIISQENEFINGYSCDKGKLFKVAEPIIIFGDHTRTLKYVDFDFILGADGVKIIKPKKGLNPKILYYCMLSNPIKSLGYARHYRELKETTISYPSDILEQQKIVSKLDELSLRTKELEVIYQKKIDDLLELKKSMLKRTFCC